MLQEGQYVNATTTIHYIHTLDMRQYSQNYSQCLDQPSIQPVLVEVPETKRVKLQAEEQKVKMHEREEEMHISKAVRPQYMFDFLKLVIIHRIQHNPLGLF